LIDLTFWSGSVRSERQLAGKSMPAQPNQAGSAKAEPQFHNVLADAVVNPFSVGLSLWTRSAAKRIFDCACVLLALPLALPVFLAIAAAVRLASPGPVFFLQKRMGRCGSSFTIFKFRTMNGAEEAADHSVSGWSQHRLTPIGAFLRRSKLDELPQLANVLLGQMSLVGPRPKPPEELNFDLPCRPGITGMATMVFAREEAIFARVPRERLVAFFYGVVIPVKQEIDAAYMARATFFSDLKLLIGSVLRRYHAADAEKFIASAAFESSWESRTVQTSAAIPEMDAEPDAFRRRAADAGGQVPAV
jgi:lipopolysaccharide/colanic/teichoic acid biosynthesis glycosyltransferase